MANIGSQATWTSGKAGNYAKKNPVAISAIGAPVPMFEQRLQQLRVQHGKDGVRPAQLRDAAGRIVRDDKGQPVIAKDSKGNTIYEGRYVQAYSLVESFGHDELDPDDPASWERAQELGRAFAEDRFPGHPALIATEVNGRSGCVHNHIIVGAIHAETGKSIDSNRVTHARLAITHDRVLAEHGFQQRADMRQITADVERRLEEARSAAEASMPDGLTETQRRRRIVAAEKAVRYKGSTIRSAGQDREDRRLREYDRYMLNEQTREAALAIGATPPAERFSEIVLESRIKNALSDPRATSWAALQEIAPQHGVALSQRGKDVRYGMMLTQADGSYAEPSRAHTRRGGIDGSGKGLGAGFRVTDVEAAMARNSARQRTADAKRRMQDLYDSGELDQEFERERAERETPAEPKKAARTVREQPRPKRAASSPSVSTERSMPAHTAAEDMVPVAVETFRSRLRGVRPSNERKRSIVEALVTFEENYAREALARGERLDHSRIPKGVGPASMREFGDYLDPAVHEQLSLRVVKNITRAHAIDAIKKNEELASSTDASASQRAHARWEVAFNKRKVARLETELTQGVFEENTPGARAEFEERKQWLSEHVAEIHAAAADREHGMDLP